MEDPDKTDVPEGAVPFNVTAGEIAEAIAAESLEVCGCPCLGGKMKRKAKPSPTGIIMAASVLGGSRGSLLFGGNVLHGPHLLHLHSAKLSQVCLTFKSICLAHILVGVLPIIELVKSCWLH